MSQNNKQRGTFAHDPRIMFREAVDLILKAWEAPEPFDWNGKVWQGEKWHIIPKPMTEIEVGIACSRTDTTLELTAEKGFLPLMSWTPTVEQVREMIDIYMSSEHKRGAAPARSRARVGRVVYVCDSVARGQARPARRRARARLRPHAAPVPPGGSNADLTFEKLIDSGFFICGDPDTVYDGIKKLYDEVGGFGTLLLIYGKDWAHAASSAAARWSASWPRSRRGSPRSIRTSRSVAAQRNNAMQCCCRPRAGGDPGEGVCEGDGEDKEIKAQARTSTQARSGRDGDRAQRRHRGD